MRVCHLHAKHTSHRVHTLVQAKNSRTFNVLYVWARVMREYWQGCWVRAARSPGLPTICQRATKLLNKEPTWALETHDSYGNSFHANFQWTNNKIPTSFCAFETKMQNVWSLTLGKKVPLIKNKQTSTCLEIGGGQNTDPQFMDYPRVVWWLRLGNWVNQVPFRVIILGTLTWNLIHSVSLP